MEDALYATVKEILADVLMLEDPGIITPESHIVTDLGAESINIAEITIALENEFDLVMPDESLQKISTVQALVTFLRELKATA